MNDPASVAAIDTQRKYAADWLLGHAWHAPHQVPDIDLLVEEGVVGWAYARALDAGDAIPAAWQAQLAVRAREAAVQHLRATDAAQRIQHVLDEARIPGLWLKGAALAQWLYPQPHWRDVGDLDLLLPDPAMVGQLTGPLADAGIVLPNPHPAGDLVTHQVTAIDGRGGIELDLHWDIGNAPLFAGRLPWPGLHDRAQALPALGAEARGLSPVDALLHACLHRAANRLTARHDRLRWLLDLHLLVARFDDGDWPVFVARAREAGIAGHCHDGLAATARLLSTVVPTQAMDALADAATGESIRSARLGEWWYVQRCNWQALPGTRSKLRWLRQSVMPDAAHLRVRYGADGAGWGVVAGRRLRDAWRRWRGWARPRESL
jgi:hypothetical protein